MASTTRQKDQIFLIGVRDLEPLSRFNQLPTIRQVLLRFHVFLSEKKSIRVASNLLVEEVIELWNKASIPTKQTYNCITQFEKIHNNWLLLKKNKGRDSQAQKQREQLFSSRLDQLFDIAHADALQLIKIPEDKKFLADQRGERKMFMTSVDLKLVKQQERAQKRKLKAEKYKQSYTESVASSSSACQQLSFSNSSSEEENVTDEYKPSIYHQSVDTEVTEQPVLTSVDSIFTTHVTSALDRNKITDREAVRLIIPLAAALGYDPSALPISRNTINRIRKKARLDFNIEVRGSFAPDYPLVVHWDGKILPDILDNKKVDRLPVLVSGDGEEKLLGVPKLTSGTGEQVASGVYNLLEEWNVKDKVRAMSFDTTSSNTGQNKGACTILESKMSRELLWLACRHHVMEIILSKVFTLCFGPSSSPEIPLFKRFKTVWENISRDDYKGLDLSSNAEEFVKSTLESIYNVISGEKQSRDDYQELMKLTMIILNKPPEKIHWRAPGAIHHARWMVKLLYSIKIFLFKSQDVMKLTRREETQLHRFVQFGALIYTKVWIEAPLATEAPGGDLQLYRNLCAYEKIDSDIAVTAKKVLERHLWYLSDELVGVALFSDRVTSSEKANIVDQMKSEPGPRLVRGNPAILTSNSTLADFASRRTLQMFSILEIDDSFSSLPPDLWEGNSDYLKGKHRVKNLRVVNDTAERGVKLFEEYNKALTKDEDEKQFLLQVVERNRKIIPTQTTKKDLTKVVLNKEKQ